MQVVIEIRERLYDEICKGESGGYFNYYLFEVMDAIRNGKVLPEKHGDLIDVDAIPQQVELKGFLEQDGMHLVTIDRVRDALENAPTILEAHETESEDK